MVGLGRTGSGWACQLEQGPTAWVRPCSASACQWVTGVRWEGVLVCQVCREGEGLGGHRCAGGGACLSMQMKPRVCQSFVTFRLEGRRVDGGAPPASANKQ